MKIHNKVIKSTTVAEKTALWGNFITAILTRTGLRFLLSHNKIFYVLNAYVVHSGYYCSRLKFAASFLKTLSQGLSGIQDGGHKAAKYWETGRSVPSPPAPAGVFLTFGVPTSCLPQNKNWKLISIFNFQFLDSVENRKTKPYHRLQHCRETKLPLAFIFLSVVDRIKVKI